MASEVDQARVEDAPGGNETVERAENVEMTGSGQARSKVAVTVRVLVYGDLTGASPEQPSPDQPPNVEPGRGLGRGQGHVRAERDAGRCTSSRSQRPRARS